MVFGSFSSRLLRWSATLFLPFRRLFGPVHRGRPSLDVEEWELEQQLPPLPAPWSGDDRWYRGGFPPRHHNELHPLVDGWEYFDDLYRTLQTARQRVTIAGWCLTPLMALQRSEDGTGSHPLADVLDEVSLHADVFVLLWSGSPALFPPTTQYVQGVQQLLRAMAPRVRCCLDDTAPFSHDHHQKAVTIDGHVAYVGGMDLTAFQGDRWDTSRHILRFGPCWHDVQMRLRGDVVRDIEETFCRRWNAVTNESLQPLPASRVDGPGTAPAQILRTLPRGVYEFAPRGEYGIRHAILSAIQRADHFIYIENQYIWAPEIVDALIEAMNRPRQHPFRIVLILPAQAVSGKYDNDDHVNTLREADGGRGILSAYCLYTAGPAQGTTGYRYLPIYVHAKVSIIDDEWCCIGSGNLNRRGLATDSEMNVQTVARSLARPLRIKLWAEHLGMSEDDVANIDTISLIDREWKAAADRMRSCLSSGGPPPPGQVLPYTSGHDPGSRMLDILQALTLEH